LSVRGLQRFAALKLQTYSPRKVFLPPYQLIVESVRGLIHRRQGLRGSRRIINPQPASRFIQLSSSK
jgi:hypothetical protein